MASSEGRSLASSPQTRAERSPPCSQTAFSRGMSLARSRARQLLAEARGAGCIQRPVELRTDGPELSGASAEEHLPNRPFCNRTDRSCTRSRNALAAYSDARPERLPAPRYARYPAKAHALLGHAKSASTRVTLRGVGVDQRSPRRLRAREAPGDSADRARLPPFLGLDSQAPEARTADDMGLASAQAGSESLLCIDAVLALNIGADDQAPAVDVGWPSFEDRAARRPLARAQAN